MKLLLVTFIVISLNLLTTRAEKVKSQENEEHGIIGKRDVKGDLEAAGTFGIGHGHGFGYRRRHYFGGGYGGYNGWRPLLYGHGHGAGYYDHPRPTYGKIIITYPKYIGHGHGYGHGHGHGHGGYGHGYGGYGRSHYNGSLKKGGFYPSRYLGTIGYGGHSGHGHGHGYGWHGYKR